MKNTYFEKMVVRLFEAYFNANDTCNIKVNHVNYGCVITYAQVMRDFGHDVDISVYDNEGYLRISKILIDGKEL